jgi:hypothetical protein
MLEISNKLIELEVSKKVGIMWYRKLREIEEELTMFKKYNNILFDNLERQQIDPFKELLSRLNIINKKIEEQISIVNLKRVGSTPTPISLPRPGWGNSKTEAPLDLLWSKKCKKSKGKGKGKKSKGN